MRYLWSHLHKAIDTILVGCSEVVLDGFYNIGFNILCFLEGDRGPVDELAFAVLGKSRGGCSGFGSTFLHFGGKLGNSSGEVCQHMMI